MENPYYFLEESFWSSPWLMLFFALSIFAIVFFRYFFLAAAYEWWTGLRLKKTFRKQQFLREFRWSVASSAIFTVLGVATLYLYQSGYTRVYTDINSYSVFYFLFSIVLYLVLYETYYYWLHRWMHMPRVFRTVHKVHHESIHTSAFTSFSFHPYEALLQFIFLPIMILVFPIHYYALGLILLLMTVSAIINHAGVEVYPKKFYKHPVGKWLIGSTHHDLHHREFTANYGLYFTFWDKWMRTESRDYEETFKKNKALTNLNDHIVS